MPKGKRKEQLAEAGLEKRSRQGTDMSLSAASSQQIALFAVGKWADLYSQTIYNVKLCSSLDPKGKRDLDSKKKKPI